MDRFHVEAESELYYNPSQLREHLKEEEEPPSTSKRSDPPHSSSNGGMSRTPSRAHLQAQQLPYGMNGAGGMPGGISPSPRGGPYPGGAGQYNSSIPPNQFYGSGGGRDSMGVMGGMGSMGGMGQIGIGGSPMTTRSGGGGGMGMGMGIGMGMDGLGITPDVRRRM